MRTSHVKSVKKNTEINWIEFLTPKHKTLIADHVGIDKKEVKEVLSLLFDKLVEQSPPLTPGARRAFLCILLASSTETFYTLQGTKSNVQCLNQWYKFACKHYLGIPNAKITVRTAQINGVKLNLLDIIKEYYNYLDCNNKTPKRILNPKHLELPILEFVEKNLYETIHLRNLPDVEKASADSNDIQITNHQKLTYFINTNHLQGLYELINKLNIMEMEIMMCRYYNEGEILQIRIKKAKVFLFLCIEQLCKKLKHSAYLEAITFQNN